MSESTVTTISERYATMNDALISASVHGLFRFSEIEQGEKRLQAIQGAFVTARTTPTSAMKTEDNRLTGVRLWVRGFDVSEEEEAQGFLGHYADILLAPLAEKKYTLIARRVDLPLKRHPLKRVLNRSHPNWGHPVLRIVKKKKRVFDSVEEALTLLMRVHEDFPDVTVPNPTKLYAMIYSRSEKPPVQKYVLEIKPHETGGFFIDYRVNTFAPRKPKVKTPPIIEVKSESKAAVAKDSEAKDGYFASKVTLDRAKKQKPVRQAKKKTDSTAD